MTSTCSFSKVYKLGIKMVTQDTWLTASSISSKKQPEKKYHTRYNPFNDIEAIPSVDSINNKHPEMVPAVQTLYKGMDLSGFS